jgi:hypothetical protein
LEKLVYPEDAKLQQRGIADKIEGMCNDILKDSFEDVVDARSRRSIEDIMVNGCYVDTKTTDVALKFKMPNLISIDRLKYLDRSLIYVIVKYDSIHKKILDVVVLDVYELNWEYLAIQNLGVGQLQIKNMNLFFTTPKTELKKEEWLLVFKKKVLEFYSNLILKTEKRRRKWEDHFIYQK